MNNFAKLKLMDIDNLAEWLDQNVAFDGAPYMFWFDQKYCKNCDSIVCKYEDGTREFDCSYCEINDKCRFFPELKKAPDSLEIVKMWLEAEVE